MNLEAVFDEEFLKLWGTLSAHEQVSVLDFLPKATLEFVKTLIANRSTPPWVDAPPTPVVLMPAVPAEPKAAPMELKGDQPHAWEKLQSFLANPGARFFSLRGAAGTGKSHLMKMLHAQPQNLIFTATNNKPAKVLSNFLGGARVKTVYSALGLRMEYVEDKLELTQGPCPPLGADPILVVDEASMVPSAVASIIKANHKLRVIAIGDVAQLNPVGEGLSPIWKFAPPEWTATMRAVLRFDSDLLDVATGVREALRLKTYDYSFAPSANVDILPTAQAWRKKICRVKNWDENKVAAWRNDTVNEVNRWVRESLGFEEAYAPGERIILGSPLVSDGNILAHVDDEFVVKAVGERRFNFPDGEIDAWVLTLEDEGFPLFVPQSKSAYHHLLNTRAETASREKFNRRKAWAPYWELKETFQDVRYGYAMTVHRLQGTTVNNVYVDSRDILCNPNRREAYRCLYVASSRASQSLSVL